ncbi:GspH/FimT family pseudopilin [Pseudomonas syringae]|nr:GspH/FimT family pseudopilin [Pseudomonas syringae]MBD8576435.1 GspH/FimT family pseudopilin [Pseudomonas syringae]MBD8791622.1 GspH/FimT family pseudopilin [Pseudomonas syringae]MBD8802520.1 GspH/FimT family pseudopilin [Pseudomonas syringae]MBD8812986.1 GspH/FimT family pseudopilin [Pseudomonas syringae]
MKQRGFTLVELLVGLAVVAILTQAAVPQLSQMFQAQQRLAAARELASGIRSARVAAITRNQAVSIQAVDDDWSQGWRILTEHNADIPDEALLIERRLSGQVRIVGNSKVAQRLRFGGLGDLLGAGNGTLFVCLNDRPASHYQVVVAVTGQVRVIEQQVSQAYCG